MTSISPSSQLITPSAKSRIRLAVALFYFGQGLGFASWASRIPTIKTALGLSEAELGTILLMLPIGQLITMPLSAALVNRFGSKVILPFAAIIYALILIPIGLSPNAWYLGASLFFYGVAGNLCNISVNTQGVLAEDMYGKSIMSSFHGAWSLAGFTGALIGLLTINFGFNTFTHFIVIVALLIGNILWNKSFLIPEENKSETGAKKTKYKPDGLIIQLGIIGFFSMATEGAMFDWSGVYFHDVVHAPEKLVTLGYASFMIMMATGRFIGDYIISKFGRQRTLQVSGILMFVGMLSSVVFPNLWVCTLAFMLVGLGVACNVPTVYSVTGKHKTIPAGVALAMVSSISFLGFLMGPPLIGYVAELFSLRYSFALFSIFGFLMFIMTSRLKVFKDQ
ncbi:MFS transporter [Sphingobacterium sp. DK4209]|uniref:MFS transporter n=1 Tax=Sphingobacterium zhuxiongii TaxID=2662364 RepID=A0A5Q0QIJ6_9SPHI|nr:MULTISPECIES: MFS transporter [unclassified Sphingobacterium]MVZ65911.1 MFS transporter [Sphingobacterium sp. DK4209]QGA28078.1 MFS transporter [Sphingobacterium sp. dk4302]